MGAGGGSQGKGWEQDDSKGMGAGDGSQGKGARAREQGVGGGDGSQGKAWEQGMRARARHGSRDDSKGMGAGDGSQGKAWEQGRGARAVARPPYCVQNLILYVIVIKSWQVCNYRRELLSSRAGSFMVGAAG